MRKIPIIQRFQTIPYSLTTPSNNPVYNTNFEVYSSGAIRKNYLIGYKRLLVMPKYYYFEKLFKQQVVFSEALALVEEQNLETFKLRKRSKN